MDNKGLHPKKCRIKADPPPPPTPLQITVQFLGVTRNNLLLSEMLALL